eukprot:190373_1
MSSNLIDDKIDGDSNINGNKHNGERSGEMRRESISESVSEFANKIISPKFLIIGGITASTVLIIEGFICFTVCFLNVRSYILSFYYIVFGLLSIAAELKFKFVARNIKVIFSNIGRGFWYFFLGTIAFGNEWWGILTAIILLLLGILNVVAGFYNKSAKPLSNQDQNKENQSAIQKVQLAQTAKKNSPNDFHSVSNQFSPNMNPSENAYDPSDDY